MRKALLAGVVVILLAAILAVPALAGGNGCGATGEAQSAGAMLGAEQGVGGYHGYFWGPQIGHYQACQEATPRKPWWAGN